MDLTQAAVAILGSGSLGYLVKAFVDRRRTKADVTDINVQTALALEERAVQRYQAATEALEVAQRALDKARAVIVEQERYILELHGILDRAGIPYPDRGADPSD